MYPAEGSVEGGTNLTITGDGFNNSTLVVIEDQEYHLGGINTIVVTENMIVVTTQSNLNSSQTVQVFVNDLEVLYDKLLLFNYSIEVTPVVYTISPSVITGSCLVTLVGQNFGKN